MYSVRNYLTNDTQEAIETIQIHMKYLETILKDTQVETDGLDERGKVTGTILGNMNLTPPSGGQRITTGLSTVGGCYQCHRGAGQVGGGEQGQ